MRPQKSISCQYIDADTGTLCTNPVSGQGRWRYCSEEHFTLARKQYKSGRNASDLRLHRSRANQMGINGGDDKRLAFERKIKRVAESGEVGDFDQEKLEYVRMRLRSMGARYDRFGEALEALLSLSRLL